MPSQPHLFVQQNEAYFSDILVLFDSPNISKPTKHPVLQTFSVLYIAWHNCDNMTLIQSYCGHTMPCRHAAAFMWESWCRPWDVLVMPWCFWFCCSITRCRTASTLRCTNRSVLLCLCLGLFVCLPLSVCLSIGLAVTNILYRQCFKCKLLTFLFVSLLCQISPQCHIIGK